MAIRSAKGGKMELTRFVLAMAFILAAGQAGIGDEVGQVKEKLLEASHGVTVKVRMEGPYTADVPLQVVCYFKYTPEGVKRMSGAPVELDKKLGDVIASLRARGVRGGRRRDAPAHSPKGFHQGRGAAPRRPRRRGRPIAGSHGACRPSVAVRGGAPRRQPGRFRPVDSRPGQLEVGRRRRGGRGPAGRPP